MTDQQAGDFGVVRTNGIIAKMIRWATKSEYNHAFICLGDGSIIEANPSGIERSPLYEYQGKPQEFSQIPLTKEQRKTIVAAAQSYLGYRYNFLDILAFALWTRKIESKWAWDRLNNSHTLMCSQLVAKAYEEAGVTLVRGRTFGQVSPGDLACVIEHKEIPSYRAVY